MKTELQDITEMQRRRLKKVVDPIKCVMAVQLSGYHGEVLNKHRLF